MEDRKVNLFNKTKPLDKEINNSNKINSKIIKAIYFRLIIKINSYNRTNLIKVNKMDFNLDLWINSILYYIKLKNLLIYFNSKMIIKHKVKIIRKFKRKLVKKIIMKLQIFNFLSKISSKTNFHKVILITKYSQ